jgi:hypothetical protein
VVFEDFRPMTLVSGEAPIQVGGTFCPVRGTSERTPLRLAAPG